MGTIHSMFAYPNIAQSQVDQLKQQMPGWGFTITATANPNVFNVSGHGVSGQVLYDPKEMFLRLVNITKTGFGKLFSDSYLDERIRGALNIE